VTRIAYHWAASGRCREVICSRWASAGPRMHRSSAAGLIADDRAPSIHLVSLADSPVSIQLCCFCYAADVQYWHVVRASSRTETGATELVIEEPRWTRRRSAFRQIWLRS
jgi:hypothetical protein